MGVGGGHPDISGLSRRSVLTGGLGLMAGGCQQPLDLAAGETGTIVRVPDGDLVELTGGLRVRLSEVEAPAMGGAPEPFAAEARSLLTRVAIGRPGQLHYGGLSRDRYDRAIAHVIVQTPAGEDVWLNGYMVRQGGGRVRSWPDNARRVRQLLALEVEARREKRGLWALDAFRVRGLDDLSASLTGSGFVIVEGPLTSVRSGADRSAALLQPKGIELSTEPRLGSSAGLQLTPGAPIRVRGRLDSREATPSIRLTHWGQVEAPI